MTVTKNNKDNKKNKKNVKIRNQIDADNYIEYLISIALKALDIVFLRLLKSIKADIADMYERYQTEDAHVTWTEFNKYDRMNKLLKRIEQQAKKEYVEVAKEIRESQQNVYIEKHMTSMYIYEQASQIPMDFDVPEMKEIDSAIEQPIDHIKLEPTLDKHRKNTLDKIRIIITQGVLNGDGYAKVAQAIEKELTMTKVQAQRVARTEMGRAQSQAALDSAIEAQNNGIDMYKQWHATLDTRTRHSHQHLDGTKRPIKEAFESSGCKGQAPHLFVGINSASENINCRCTLLFYMDEDELPTVRRGRNVDGSTEIIPFKPYRQWYEEHYSPNKDKIYETKARKQLLDNVNNGKIKVNINPEKQNKHQEHERLYQEYLAKQIASNKPNPSIMTISNDELDDLIQNNYGKGKPKYNDYGDFINKEVIDFGKNIGKAYVNGEYINTNLGTVHYSRTGTHIIPLVRKG